MTSKTKEKEIIEMILKPIVAEDKYGAKLDPYMYRGILDDLKKNGAAVPDITHVLFNFGKKTEHVIAEDGTKTAVGEYPVLTTVLSFTDGSKTTVISSKSDGLQLDEAGKPTKFSKECGIMFALAKRILAAKYSTEDGGMSYSGFGKILCKLVDEAYDCQEEEAKQKAKKAELKKQVIKPKEKPQSLAKAVKELTEVIKVLKDRVIGSN